MKIKFIIFTVLTFFSLQFAQARTTSISSTIVGNSVENKLAPTKQKSSEENINMIEAAKKDEAIYKAEKSKDKKDKAKKVELKDASEVKTFDFDRIFREANRYFEAAQSWKVLKCIPKTGFICSKRECPQIKIPEPAALVMDRNQKTLAICRNRVCEYYPAQFEQTGIFTNVRVQNSQGLVIRVLGDSRFKEIVIIGLDAYITNGECEALES